ncbi:unnamed protein product [Lampetra fluviatilis]
MLRTPHDLHLSQIKWLRQAVLSRCNYGNLVRMLASTLEKGHCGHSKHREITDVVISVQAIPAAPPARVPKLQLLLAVGLVLHAVPAGSFQGEARSRSPFSTVISPAELAVLHCLLQGGTTLSLKAHDDETETLDQPTPGPVVPVTSASAEEVTAPGAGAVVAAPPCEAGSSAGVTAIIAHAESASAIVCEEQLSAIVRADETSAITRPESPMRLDAAILDSAAKADTVAAISDKQRAGKGAAAAAATAVTCSGIDCGHRLPHVK